MEENDNQQDKLLHVCKLGLIYTPILHTCKTNELYLKPFIRPTITIHLQG